MTEQITIDTFQINDVFKVYYSDNQYVELTLIKTIKFPYVIKNLPREPFALVFRGSKSVYINPDLYLVEQERLGKFELGLSPTVAEYGQNEAHYYEATFC